MTSNKNQLPIGEKHYYPTRSLTATGPETHGGWKHDLFPIGFGYFSVAFAVKLRGGIQSAPASLKTPPLHSKVPSLKLTFSPLDMDGWRLLSFLGFEPSFRGKLLNYVSGRGSWSQKWIGWTSSPILRARKLPRIPETTTIQYEVDIYIYTEYIYT